MSIITNWGEEQWKRCLKDWVLFIRKAQVGQTTIIDAQGKQRDIEWVYLRLHGLIVHGAQHDSCDGKCLWGTHAHAEKIAQIGVWLSEVVAQDAYLVVDGDGVARAWMKSPKAAQAQAKLVKGKVVEF